MVFDQLVDPAAPGTPMKAGAQGREVVRWSCDDNFNLPFFGVADPAAQVEVTGLAVNEPAETYALYPALNQKVKNHR